MTLSQLKAKIEENTQLKVIPFKNGIPIDSWVKCFRNRHLDLVLRVPQGLDHKKEKALNPQLVAQYYSNLESLYNEHHYDSRCIWNIDEFRCQALQSGLAKVFAKRDLREVYKVIPAKKE